MMHCIAFKHSLSWHSVSDMFIFESSRLWLQNGERQHTNPPIITHITHYVMYGTVVKIEVDTMEQYIGPHRVPRGGNK